MAITRGTVINKYEILEYLSEGGLSHVYKAVNRETGTLAAVKFMKDKVTSTYTEDLVRFKRDIDGIGRLDHPNIVKILDTGTYNDALFVVMEFLEGESLAGLLKKEGALDAAEATDIASQIAEALNCAHGSGIIHKDLKPGNVFLVKSEGKTTVKLLDFGISHIIELGEILNSKEAIETFAYMSPEATGILNKRVDERSDLYSLGVIIYRTLTGSLPFGAEDINKLMHEQAALSPARPGSLTPSIPADLENIIMKLLRKEQDLRYQSAKGLLYDIERYKNGELSFVPGEKDRKDRLDYYTRLVGRENEINKIKMLFDESIEGKGSVCLIGGEAGIGKSRLAEEIISYVYGKDGIFIRGRCPDHENKRPYQPFKDALDEYIKEIEKKGQKQMDLEISRVKDVVGNFGEIIIKLNPGMEKLLGKPAGLITLEHDRENQRHLMVLVDFFCRLAENGRSCVLYLDDLHWADESSLNLLMEILKKVGHSNLLVLGLYRNNEIAQNHGIGRIKNEWRDRPDSLHAIELAPLDYRLTNRLVAYILNEEEDRTANISEYVFNKSKGNPFFIINMIRELVENRVITLKDWQMEGFEEKLKGLHMPKDLLDLVLRRIKNLNESQVGFLCKTAVLGRKFDTGLLYRLFDLPRDSIVTLIDEAIGLQFLEEGPDKGHLLFAHDKIRDAFYSRLDGETRRKIHLKVAMAIEDINKNRLENAIYDLAYHYVEAGDCVKSLEYAKLAGDKAKHAYANEESIKYYKIVVKLLESMDKKGCREWIKINQSLIDLYLTVGKNDEAMITIQAMMPMLENNLDKAAAYKKMGMAYFKMGNWEKCEDNLAKCLELLGGKMPRSKAGVLFASAKELLIHIFHCFLPFIYSHKKSKPVKAEDKEIILAYETLTWMYLLSDLNKVLHSVLRILNISEKRIGLSRELGMGLGAYASICMTIPLSKRAIRYFTESYKMKTQLGDEWGAAQSLQFLGFAHSWRGMYHESIQKFESSKAGFQRIGDAWELGMVFNGLGYAYHYLSDYKTALYYHNEYLRLSQEIKDLHGAISAKMELGFCYVEQGDFMLAEELLTEALDSSEEKEIWFSIINSLIYYGYLELERGNYDEAIIKLERARKIYREKKFIKDYVVLLFPYLAEAYIKKCGSKLRKAESRPARQDVKKLFLACREAITETKAWPNHYGGALRAFANYYFLTGKYRKSEKYFFKSIGHIEKINRPYELAKTYFDYGHLMKASGKSKEAGEKWEKAYAVFSRIGAKEYARKCLYLLENSRSSEADPGKSLYDMEVPGNRYRLKIKRGMDTVLKTGTYISSILDIDELLEKILDSAVELLGAERGILLFYPKDRDRGIVIRIKRNFTEGEMEGERFLPIRNIITRVEIEKTPLIISGSSGNGSTHLGLNPEIHGIRSVICAPILSKREILGVIYLDSSMLSGLFDKEDLKILNGVSNQAGVSIENARLYSELKSYSRKLEEAKEGIASLNQTLEQRVLERTIQLNSVNDELNEKNKKLLAAYEQLKEHAATVEELAVSTERNRLARDVHDTLGHSMVLLLTLLEVCRVSCKNDPEKTTEQLKLASEVTRNGLGEIRRSIQGLAPGKLISNDLILALKKLIADFQISGVNVDFTVDENIESYAKPYAGVIYRICQEALTNSLRHGNADEVNIMLLYDGDRIKLFIFDNGKGCKTVKPGQGLTGMKQRVEEMNGKLLFGSDGEKGFSIRVELPICS